MIVYFKNTAITKDLQCKIVRKPLLVHKVWWGIQVTITYLVESKYIFQFHSGSFDIL